MRVAYYQFRPLFGKPRRNLDKVVARLDGCGAELVVLPELAFTGYYFRDRNEALALAEDPRRSATVDALRALCRGNGFRLVAGFAERRAERCFNSALLIGPNGIEQTYRKLHLFNEEKLWFDPGDTELRICDIGPARIGMMICFDWLFPEAARALALQGAEILCHPSNLVLGHCQKVMQARCLENRVYAVTANRCGADRRPHGELRFTGRSQIVAPDGERLCAAPARREQLRIEELDPGRARDKRITARNEVFADRRPRYYAPAAAPAAGRR